MAEFESRALGRTRAEVTSLGFGTVPLAGFKAKVSFAEAQAIVKAAYDGGIRYFDCAPLYGFDKAEYIRALNRFGLAYLHFVEGATGGTREIPAGIDLDALRSEFDGPYIGNNGYDLDLAMNLLGEGRLDAVAFGRPVIADPDLVHRLRRNLPLTEAPREAYYGGGTKGYTASPEA